MLRDGVVYQVYPRSFQDSDGDGVGDLRGIEARLDHLAWLGVDALWMSPIFPSPMHDFGYDISDYTNVDPVFGSLADFDSLVAAARARGLEVLLDLVPCHTSIEHPWFREHPDWYIWTDAPNNWLSAFGGSAWSRRDGRWYLHSFYPEQADLDWRNPEVIAAMQDVLRFWLERGVAGYRVDAIDRLLKDPQLRDDPPASEPFGLPLSDGGGAAVARALAQRARHGGGAREDPRGRRAALPRRRGLPPEQKVAAVPRVLRCRVRVRVAPRPLECRGAAGGHRGDHPAAGRRVGALEPRLRPARHALRPRERARGGAPAADASGDGVPVPGRRDRPGRGPAGRTPLRPRRTRPLPPPDAVGRLAARVASRAASRGCRSSIRRA